MYNFSQAFPRHHATPREKDTYFGLLSTCGCWYHVAWYDVFAGRTGFQVPPRIVITKKKKWLTFG